MIEYVPTEKDQLDTEVIDIIAKGCFGFNVNKIHCKTIYDIATLMEGQAYSGGKMRLRGVKFVKLNHDQEKEMKSLLKNCFDAST